MSRPAAVPPSGALAEVDRPVVRIPGDPLAVLDCGGMGDHLTVHQLLMAVFQGPARESFFSSLDDPFYEPCDRLLVRRGLKTVAHLQVMPRTMHFGQLRFPVAGLCALATLPEFRRRGYGRTMLAAAESSLVADDVVLGLLTTKIPHFFRPSGWAVCGRHSHAYARTRDLLAQLSTRGVTQGESAINIRPWRQVELPALMHLHADNTLNAVGTFERTEAYWRWLVSRQGFDQIYVALEGPERFSLDIATAPIVGYVVTKEARILELMVAPGRQDVAEHLLARACGDAIERDFNSVQLHAPPDSPLHALFAIAGGTLYQHEACQGEVHMVKVVDPVGFLRRIGPELQLRAEAADCRSCELGIAVENERYRLRVSRRGATVSRAKLGRSYLRCNQAEFTRLVLGHLDLDEAIAQGRLQASTRLALETARILFPRLPIWRSPWDELYL